MKIVSYAESHARFAELLDSVADDRDEVVVTRAGHESVVIMSLVEFEAPRETAHLMRSPENARRLLGAVDRLENGTSQWHQSEDAD